MVGDVQEAEDIELIDVLDTGVGKSENSPSQLEKRDIKRNVDLCFLLTYRVTCRMGKLGWSYPGEEQIRRNLSKHVGGTPDGVGIVELGSVKRKILLHAAICTMT